MPKLQFAMVIHFHQPAGNFPEVFEKVYKNCYQPFLETLHKFPDIKIGLHFTGCLLEWLEENHKDFFKLVVPLVTRGQVEILTGGFYEPILPIIPARDRQGQIRMLTDFVKDRFGYAPSGAWVAERVWEPALASSLHDAGVKYIILDDTHFFYAGLKKEAMYGYYTTEDQNKPIAVCASDKVLRYLIPFQPPEKVTEYFSNVLKNHEQPFFVYADDAEKFGEWPGTYQWVYEKKWLYYFFEMLVKNKDWIQLVKISDYIKHHGPQGRVYIPTASYEEMSEWSLPSETGVEFEEVLGQISDAGKEDFYKPFIRGGFWRNFLSKYPESNQMHKKMLAVSAQLESLEPGAHATRDIDEAKRFLYRGQCNCAYWHGVFGGIYLYHLRKAVYENLLHAEAILDAVARKEHKPASVVTTVDFDGDGRKELVFKNEIFSGVIAPAQGGMITELDYRPRYINLSNVIARRKETYHEDISNAAASNGRNGSGVRTIHEAVYAVTEELKRNLIYDDYRKGMFLEHFIGKEIGYEQFRSGDYDEEGDFLEGNYAYRVHEIPNSAHITLERKGSLREKYFSVRKEFSWDKKKHAIIVTYVLTNGKDEIKKIKFGTEFNFIMPAANAHECRYSSKGISIAHAGMESHGVVKDAKEYGVRDTLNKVRLDFSFDRKTGVWRYPFYSVSKSERSYELNYQGSTLMFWWDMDFKPREEKKRVLILSVR